MDTLSPLARWFKSEHIANQYTLALEYYWNQDYEKSLDLVNTSIQSSPHNLRIFAFYRLWIEILSELEERRSLRAFRTSFEKNWHWT